MMDSLSHFPDYIGVAAPLLLAAAFVIGTGLWIARTLRRRRRG
jgi:hypothetical protein